MAVVRPKFMCASPPQPSPAELRGIPGTESKARRMPPFPHIREVIPKVRWYHMLKGRPPATVVYANSCQVMLWEDCSTPAWMQWGWLCPKQEEPELEVWTASTPPSYEKFFARLGGHRGESHQPRMGALWHPFLCATSIYKCTRKRHRD